MCSSNLRACGALAPLSTPKGEPEHAGRLLAYPPDLRRQLHHHRLGPRHPIHGLPADRPAAGHGLRPPAVLGVVEHLAQFRSEEHTSELQSLMRNSYAVFCLKKKKHQKQSDATTK